MLKNLLTLRQSAFRPLRKVAIQDRDEAQYWARALRAGTSLTQIARQTGRSEPYIRTRNPLAFLAPKLQVAIFEGRQSVHLSVAQLIRDDIPMGWDEQERFFQIG